MTARSMLLTTITAVMALSSSSTRAEPCRIAVLDLEAQGLPAAEAHLPRALGDAVATAVAEVSGCQVVSASDIASMAGFEAQRQACGVDSASCLAELGSALGVQRVVTGSVARIGSGTTIAVRLLHLDKGLVEARAEETTTDAGALRPLALRVGRSLFAPTTAAVSDDDGGPPAMLIAGGVGVGVGVVGLAAGLILALPAEGTLADATASSAAKDDAIATGTIGLVIAGVSGVVVVVGAALATLGMME